MSKANRRVGKLLDQVQPRSTTPTISQQVEKISDVFTKIYIAELRKSGKENQAEILTKIFAFQKEGRSYEQYSSFLAKELLGKKDGAKLSLQGMEKFPDFIDALGEFAKVNDSLRRMRSVANQEFFDVSLKNQTADSFEYVLEQFAKKNTPIVEVQKYLDNVRISTSTTSHPTNPTGVYFTREAMKLADVFSKFTRSSNWEEIEKKLRAQVRILIKTPMVEQKKTQAQEVEEGLLYVDAIYDNHLQISRDIAKAVLQNHGMQYLGLKLPENVFDPCVWITGDGDGNPNSTEASLRLNIAAFQARVKQRYAQELQKIGAPGQEILTKLQSNFYGSNVAEFIKDLEKNGLLELASKAKIFGFHYAKIDIRHEAGDIMKAVLNLLKKVEAVLADKKDLTAQEIQSFFGNEVVVAKIKALQTAGIEDELTRRIFGRLRAIGENSDMSGKLIIAEFKTPANAEAALFLLKVSGNETCNGKAKMSVVPLAEEKETLERLPQDLAIVLQGNYLEHIKHAKKIYFMIAKSDTVRRDGIGAQESQESAVKNSIKEIVKSLLKHGINDLENYEIAPFNGGGHALQRGGGRLSELSSVYGRHALKALNELKAEGFDAATIDKIKISAPCLTVQGHQNYLLFSPNYVGGGFLSSMASQALYAEARLRGKFSDKEVESSPEKKMTAAEMQELKQKAKAARKIASEASVEKYQIVKEPDGVINKLFENACWVSTKVDNKSSRASIRGLGDAGIAAGTTFESIKGKGNKLLDQRAIGAEKLCSHSGTHLISWFSVKDGLQAVKDLAAQGKGCSLNEMYRGSKATRDSMRGVATSLFMVDFKIAWPMMIGVERPTPEQISGWQGSYKEKLKSGRKAEIRPEETLSFLEGEFLETAKLVYETIYGKEAEADFNPKQLLDKWPDIEEEIEHREERIAFAHFMEAFVTDEINKNPQIIVTPENLKLLEHSYCGADFTNAPLGILLSLTKSRDKEVGSVETQIYQDFVQLGAVIEASDKAGARMERLVGHLKEFPSFKQIEEPSASVEKASSESLVAKQAIISRL